MPRGLKIESNFYLNMDSIITWKINSEGINIVTSFTKNSRLLITTKEPGIGMTSPYVIVSIQELKRIIKELNEYMGTH